MDAMTLPSPLWTIDQGEAVVGLRSGIQSVLKVGLSEIEVGLMLGRLHQRF